MKKIFLLSSLLFIKVFFAAEATIGIRPRMSLEKARLIDQTVRDLLNDDDPAHATLKQRIIWCINHQHQPTEQPVIQYMTTRRIFVDEATLGILAFRDANGPEASIDDYPFLNCKEPYQQQQLTLIG